MSVILKKEEKVKKVIDSLPENYTENDFLTAFIEMYPDDYAKCKKVWLKEERKTKPGQKHPMPQAEKYIINALHFYISKEQINRNFEDIDELSE